MAIANGETTTGVTTMRIDAGMDTGEMLLRRETAIGPARNHPGTRSALGGDFRAADGGNLRGLRDGTIEPIPQNHAEASMDHCSKGGRPHHWSLTPVKSSTACAALLHGQRVRVFSRLRCQLLPLRC